MPRQVMIAACMMAVAALSNSHSFGIVFARAAEGLGLSVAQLGGLRTLENATGIIVAILVAPLIDRFPRKYVLLLGYGAATAASLTIVLTGAPAGAIVFFMLNGASIMLILGTLTAMPSDFISGRPLTRFMGILMGCIAFTSVIVTPIVGHISERFSWEAGMLVSTTATATAFLITLFVIPGYRVDSGDSSSVGILQRYRVLLRQPPLLLMLGSNFFRYAQNGSLMTFISTILLIRYGLLLGRIGLIFAVIGIVFFLSSAACGMYLHVLKTRRVLVWGSLVVAILLAGVVITPVPLSVALVGLVLSMAILAAQINTGTVAVLRLSPWARGAAMSWNELAAACGSLTGIGLCSIGIAIAGLPGLGVVLASLAAGGALMSRIALSVSGYTDEDDMSGSTEVQPQTNQNIRSHAPVRPRTTG